MGEEGGGACYHNKGAKRGRKRRNQINPVGKGRDNVALNNQPRCSPSLFFSVFFTTRPMDSYRSNNN